MTTITIDRKILEHIQAALEARCAFGDADLIAAALVAPATAPAWHDAPTCAEQCADAIRKGE